MNWLKVIGGPIRGKKFALRKGSYSIGRENNAQIQLESPMVSRLHATIEVKGNEVMLIDHGSSNGTLVNGTRIDKIKLRNGDKVFIGNFVLEYAVETDSHDPLDIDTFSKKKASARMLSSRIGSVSKLSTKFSWSATTAALLLILIGLGGFFTVNLANSKLSSDLQSMALSKGIEIARYLAEKNKLDLARGNEMLLDVSTVMREKSVREALIVDENALILVPLAKQNQPVTDPYVLEALNSNMEKTVVSPRDMYGNYVFAHPIRVLKPKSDKFKTIGVAKIVFSPRQLIYTLPSKGRIPYTFLLPLLLVAAIIFVVIKRLTLDPLKSLVERTEQARIQGTFEGDEYASEFLELAQSIKRLSATLQTYKSEEKAPSFSAPPVVPIVNNEKIDSILSAIPEAAIVFDNEMIILSINEEALNFFGISGESPLGKKIPEIVTEKKITNAIEDIIEEANSSGDPSVNKTLEVGLKMYELTVTGIRDHTGMIEFGTLIIEKI